MLMAMKLVASYVGAWIETHVRQLHITIMMSHPTWVRGLKLMECLKEYLVKVSHPTWVRGLKLLRTYTCSVCLCRILRGCVD